MLLSRPVLVALTTAALALALPTSTERSSSVSITEEPVTLLRRLAVNDECSLPLSGCDEDMIQKRSRFWEELLKYFTGA